jgi:hypothetical protein
MLFVVAVGVGLCYFVLGWVSNMVSTVSLKGSTAEAYAYLTSEPSRYIARSTSATLLRSQFLSSMKKRIPLVPLQQG